MAWRRGLAGAGFYKSSATRTEQTEVKNKGKRGPGTSQIRYKAGHQAYWCGVGCRNADPRSASIYRMAAAFGSYARVGWSSSRGKQEETEAVGSPFPFIGPRSTNRAKIAKRLDNFGRNRVLHAPDAGLKKGRAADKQGSVGSERNSGVGLSGREGKGMARGWSKLGCASRAWPVGRLREQANGPRERGRVWAVREMATRAKAERGKRERGQEF